MCDTPIDVVERALLDPGAEIILILAKVAGLSTTTTKAVLLLRAADRGMSAKDLEQALDELQPIAAGNRAPGAQLLPHPREKAGRAHGCSGGRRQRLTKAPYDLICALRWSDRRCNETTTNVARYRQSWNDDRDEALKVFLQNFLDSILIAFMWGISRCWSVRVD